VQNPGVGGTINIEGTAMYGTLLNFGHPKPQGQCCYKNTAMTPQAVGLGYHWGCHYLTEEECFSLHGVNGIEVECWIDRSNETNWMLLGCGSAVRGPSVPGFGNPIIGMRGCLGQCGGQSVPGGGTYPEASSDPEASYGPEPTEDAATPTVFDPGDEGGAG
jgi:hypothetical protein